MAIKIISNLTELIQEPSVVQQPVTLLPLCHTTKESNLGNILNHGILKSGQLCPVFGERTIFFFYGKAKYVPSDEVKLQFGRYAPITFLYALECIKNQSPKRMLPFDSGGHKLYDLEIELEEFVIMQPDQDKPEELIRKFQYNLEELIRKLFHSNENYLERTLKIEPRKYPACFPLKELERLYQAAKTAISTSYGDQAFTIELQYEDAAIPFSPFGAVLPLELFSACTPQQLKEMFGEMYVYTYGDGKPLEMIKKYDRMQERVKEIIANYAKGRAKKVA